MKNHLLFPASLLLTLFLYWGCQGDSATTITYPRVFELSGYEMGQVQYHVVTANGFGAIQNYPAAAQVENGIRAELDEDWQEGTELKRIEFTSETEALGFALDSDSSLFSVPATVHTQGNDLTLDFGGGLEVALTKNDDFTELSLCNISYLYTYYNDLADRIDYSPAFFEVCYTDDQQTILTNISNENNLVIGDTIISYFLDIIYRIQ